MLRRLAMINIALRGLMEAAIVVGFAVWGFGLGDHLWQHVLLAVAMPTIGFGIWGAIDVRWAGSLGEILRLLEELAISFFAALAWNMAGHTLVAIGLAVLSVAHHGLVYLTGNRLLH